MLYPFILTTLSGLSTLIGALPIFINFKNPKKLISSSCAFSAGVMSAISILDLIPEGIHYIKQTKCNLELIILSIIYLNIGIIITIIIDRIINNKKDNKLYKIGLLAFLAIIIHNIPEGIVTYIVTTKNIYLGITIAISIAIHNIPEGISISIPIYYSTQSRILALTYTFIAATSELLGALITNLFLNQYINNYNLGIIFLITAGIMLSISLEKLIPESTQIQKENTIPAFIIGFIIMLFSLLLNSLIF